MKVRDAISLTFVCVFSCCLTGCTQPDQPSLPSISDYKDGGQSSSHSEQAANLLTCLLSDDVPVHLESSGDDAAIHFDGTHYSYVCYAGGCQTQSLANGDAYQSESDIYLYIQKVLTSRFPPQNFPDPWSRDLAITNSFTLVIDDVDYSASFEKCMTDSGYQDPADAHASQYELEQKERLLQVTLRWAECSRSSGVSTADPQRITVDGWETVPTALLPISIDAPQLEHLLDQCPPLLSVDESLGGGEEYASIGFDTPGFRGKIDDGLLDDPELTARLATLLQMIDSLKEQAYDVPLPTTSPK